jgi:hypothetical protein
MDLTTLILFGGSVDLSLWVGAFRALDKHPIRYPRIVATANASPFAALLASGYRPDEIGNHWANLIANTPVGGLNPRVIEDWLRNLLLAKNISTFEDLRGRGTPELKLIAVSGENMAPLTFPDDADRLGLTPARIEIAAIASASGVIAEVKSGIQNRQPTVYPYSPGQAEVLAAAEGLVKPETKPLYFYSEPAEFGFFPRMLSRQYKNIFELDERALASSRVNPVRVSSRRFVGLKLPNQLRINARIVADNAEKDATAALEELRIETIQQSAEGTSIERYPEVEVTGRVLPRQELKVSVDLKLRATASTGVDALVIDGLDPGWQEMYVRARLVAPFLSISRDKQEGEIKVRNGQSSIPFTFSCNVRPDLPAAVEEFDLLVNFFYNGRYLGSTVRILHLGEDLGLHPAIKTDAAASQPAESKNPKPKSLHIERAAPAPKLTVVISHPRGLGKGELLWQMQVPDDVREFCTALPPKLTGDTDLGPDPETFVKGIVKALEQKKVGRHVDLFEGIGQRIYEKSPQAFKDTYWAMVSCFDQTFPIQFVTDEPYVPWEFMLPSKDEETGARCLAINHPVARWLVDYESKRATKLPSGSIITIAPNYPSGWEVEPLPAARVESDTIKNVFGAIQVPGIYAEVMGVFEDLRNVDVGILHFAGHGADLSDPNNAAILLEDRENVTVLEVRRPKTLLGKRRRTLAFFNVCRGGTIGETLGTVGGWAEALINKEFSGFIAPMWAIYDQNAATVSTKFLNSIRNDKRTVAEALRQIREEYGTYSPTYLSYIFYGDVMAKFS